MLCVPACTITAFTGLRKTGNLDFEDVGDAMGYIGQNLATQPLMDVSPTSSLKCPTGYSEMLIGKWPGTERGCYCKFSGSLSRGSCSRGSSCRNITSARSRELHIWKDYLWCGKRAVEGTDYVKALICPDGYIECYPGYCYKSECPLTKLFFSDTPVAGSVPYISRFLVKEKEVEKLPVFNVETELNSVPCFNPEETPSGGSAYVLRSRMPKGCGTYGEDTLTSFMMDTDNEYDLLISNGLENKIEDLPKFEPAASETLVQLSGRTRINVTKKGACLDMDPEPFQKAEHRSGILFYGTLVCGILVLAFWLFAIFTLLTNRNKTNLLIFLCLQVIVILVMGIMNVIVASMLSKSLVAAKDARDYGCFPDRIPQLVMSDFIVVFEGVKTIYYSSLVLLIVTVLCTLGFILAQKCGRD